MTGDKFMPEFHLKQPGFTYSACGPFTKIVLGLKNDAAYSDSTDLAKRTISDKILKDRAYEIARNRNYDEYQRKLESMVYNFFDKKTGWE